ncbi:MAG: aminotransferase class I/II-fold pyridoxal phosphate-dependent enzyme [Anaerolineales bacterium]|nr:aminotransferase class I/II-fold pyridoxal phosphate-dependent enzyme [Anaerolineales bacterium]
MRIPLDRKGPTPLYRQIQSFLREQIRTGHLIPESRLPASRLLAESLGVSRITVVNAYAELEAEGLVYSRPGSGTYVAAQLRPFPEVGDYNTGRDWPLWQQELLSRSWQPLLQEIDKCIASVEHPDLISFTAGLGAKELFPVDDFGKTMREVLRRDGMEALDYGDPAGYPPLRTTIAHILTSQGIPTHPDEVLVTSGSMQAIAMVAHLTLNPGDVVFVESPTYSMIIDLFRSVGARIQGIPVDEQGMMVEHMEDLMQSGQPNLVYAIPTFQNPTGSCMSGQRRRQLIALAERYNVPVLEDDFAGDLRYGGRVQPALKAMDPGGRVIYVSTFSKMLMPALRVGFLVASGPALDRLLALKRTMDLATSNLMQRALEAYITVGRYQAHLRRACRVYRQRRDAMADALKSSMPPGITWQVPDGGLFLWQQLPADWSADELFPLAGEEGVIYAPGSFFYPGGRVKRNLRLNFAMHPPERIVEGVKRLARAIERYTEWKQQEYPQSLRERQVPV